MQHRVAAEAPLILTTRTLERPWHVAAWIARGLAVFTASYLMRPGYDEFYWLAIARKVTSGGTLYVDAIDNKTPLVYGLVWLRDPAPGTYVLARSMLMTDIAAGAAYLALRARNQETTAGSATLVAATAALTLVLQNQLASTTDLIAVFLLLLSTTLVWTIFLDKLPGSPHFRAVEELTFHVQCGASD